MIGIERLRYLRDEIPDHDSMEHYLKDKLLPVASGPNGDTLAIDFSIDNCPVGLVTHEDNYPTSDFNNFPRDEAIHEAVPPYELKSPEHRPKGPTNPINQSHGSTASCWNVHLPLLAVGVASRSQGGW